jgi:hypothetical protein
MAASSLRRRGRRAPGGSALSSPERGGSAMAAASKRAPAKNKTRPTARSVTDFINAVENETRRKDAETVLALMKKITGETPKMWGPSIVGFGSYHYRYESGREGDFMKIGFSPRKANLVLYVMPGFTRRETLLNKLGKHKTGKSCLYVNTLADVDMDVLERLIADAWARMNAKHPA